jgi:hypothetical protein
MNRKAGTDFDRRAKIHGKFVFVNGGRQYLFIEDKDFVDILQPPESGQVKLRDRLIEVPPVFPRA